MNERDKRLFPAVMARLASVTADPRPDAEIAADVRWVQRALASDGQTIADLKTDSTEAGDFVSMDDDNLHARVRLRDLGLMLRHVHCLDLNDQHALNRAQIALINGTAMSGADLRHLLRCLRDLLHQKLQAAREPAREHLNVMRFTTTQVNAASASGLTLEALRRMQEEMSREMNRAQRASARAGSR